MKKTIECTIRYEIQDFTYSGYFVHCCGNGCAVCDLLFAGERACARSGGIQNAAYNYINNNGIVTKGKDVEITISSIKDVIIDGNTYYYIIDTEGNKYRVNIKISSSKLPFIKVGDKLLISYSDKDLREITSIK